MHVKKFARGLNALLEKGTYIPYHVETQNVKYRYILHRVSLMYSKTKDKSRIKIADKYDRKFMGIISYILKQNRWHNRRVIVASRDWGFIKAEGDILKKSQLLTFAHIISELEKILISQTN